MRTRLVRIGNSRGIRLPKPLIEQVGLADEVDLEVGEGTLIIRPAGGARAGWADAARALATEAPQDVLDAPTATRFDQEEWTW